MSTPSFVKYAPWGLFMAFLTLMAWMIAFAIVVRWNSLPNLAKSLPGQETEAFWIFSTEDLIASQLTEPVQLREFMGTSLAELPWVTTVGGAWVNGQTVQVAEVTALGEEQTFLESLKAPEETWAYPYDGVACYTQAQPYCWMKTGALLWVSTDAESLHLIQEVRSGEQRSLADDSRYIDVKNRLAVWDGGFVYADVQKVKTRWMDDFGLLSQALELFPAYGASLKWEEGAWRAESFLAANKDLIDGPLAHPTQLYQAHLLAWAPETLAWEWGTQDLAAQMEQMEAVLGEISPASALLLESKLDQSFARMGEGMSWETWKPLLNGEQYVGFTPGGDFVFMTELRTEEERAAAAALKEQLLINQQVVELTRNVLIVSSSKQLALSTVDRAEGRSEARSLGADTPLLLGSNEIAILHCPLLPDGHILKALLSDFETVLSTRKEFDDGIFTRTHLSAY